MTKCDVCHFENPDGFAYCGRCGNWLSNSKETFDSQTIEGERKQVTIIFADISGFTALNDAAKTPADVERVLQVVNHCLDMFSEVVYEYDGYIDKYMGDAIMAIFGAPRTHEDDPERALRAALSMRERLEEFNRNPPFPLAEPLGIHMGINTGTVIAGLYGSKRKRSYTVMGDAVNVTSRLESVSERGEFLVSQDTYNLTHRLFVFKERETVSVKGKREPLKFFELIDARRQRASQRGIAGLRAPMVGREKEFDQLRRKTLNLNKYLGSISVIIGEAGLGKSRLTSELQQETARKNRDLVWIEGRGLSFQQHLSYKLFIEILRQYLGVSGDEGGEVVWQKWLSAGKVLFNSRRDEVIPYLATLMGIKLPENVTQSMPLSDSLLLQQRMFLAVGEWVETVVNQHPMVLVFEDLHWADSNSVNLLEYLMTVSQEMPLHLICVTRPERETDFWAVKERAYRYYPDRYSEVNLAPLTKDQSRFLVDRLLSVEQLPDTLEHLILSRSEGNPLFMEEVLRSLIEDETLIKAGDTWTMSRPVTEIFIPETLAGVLTARIDRLDEPVKRTLQIASVIGRVFHRHLLEAIMENTANLDSYLAALLGAELIRERPNEYEEEYIFKHVLVQEAAYNSLLLQQRRVYHKQLADYLAQLYWIRGEEYASEAARHYEQGDIWKRAITYLIRSAEASKSAFDIDNAVNFYSRALSLAGKVDDLEAKTLIEAHEGRGNLLKRLGRVDEAQADFEEVFNLAVVDEDAAIQMRALSELGKLHGGYQDYNQTARYFERALEIARAIDDKPGIVDTLNELGDFHLNMGQLAHAETTLEEALTIATSVGNTRQIANSRNGLATVRLYRGDIAASIDQLEDLVQSWRNLGDYQGLMRAYVPLATAYTWQADYKRSDQTCQDALEILERFGDMTWVPQFRFYLAYNAFARGNLSEAEANIAEAIDISKRIGKGLWHAAGLAYRGYYRLFRIQSEDAFVDITQAVEMVETISSPLWINRLKLVQSLALRFREESGAAEALLLKAYQDAGRMGLVADEVMSLGALLEGYLAGQQWTQIDSVLDIYKSLSEASGMKTFQARALLAEARLAEQHGRSEVAADLLLQADHIVQATGDCFDEFVIKVNLANLLALQGRKKEARTALQKAEKVLKQIAGAILDEVEQQYFLTWYQKGMVNRLKEQLSPAGKK